MRPLFESLKQFRHNNKQLHVEKINFMDALDKVKSTLDLRDPCHVTQSGEIVISFVIAWTQFEEHLPEYFTWDNLFDVLLFQTVASQFIYNLHEAPDMVFQDSVSGFPQEHEDDNDLELVEAANAEEDR